MYLILLNIIINTLINLIYNIYEKRNKIFFDLVYILKMNLKFIF